MSFSSVCNSLCKANTWRPTCSSCGKQRPSKNFLDSQWCPMIYTATETEEWISNTVKAKSVESLCFTEAFGQKKDFTIKFQSSFSISLPRFTLSETQGMKVSSLFMAHSMFPRLESTLDDQLPCKLSQHDALCYNIGCRGSCIGSNIGNLWYLCLHGFLLRGDWSQKLAKKYVPRIVRFNKNWSRWS